MSSLDLPPVFSQVTSLGDVEAVYRSSPPSMKGKFISWLVATIIVGIIFAIGYFGEGTLRNQGMEMVAVAAQMLGMFGLVVVGGVWFVGLVALSLLNLILFARPQVVAVYRDGIANYDKGKLQAWKWGDMGQIYAYFFADTVTNDTGIGARFDIVHRNGSIFSINHLLADCPELIERLRQEVYSRIRSEIARAVEAGQNVPFGKNLTVEPDGVRVVQKLTPWDALQGQRIEHGMLILAVKKSSPAQIPYNSIPNIELLRELLESKLARSK